MEKSNLSSLILYILSFALLIGATTCDNTVILENNSDLSRAFLLVVCALCILAFTFVLCNFLLFIKGEVTATRIALTGNAKTIAYAQIGSVIATSLGALLSGISLFTQLFGKSYQPIILEPQGGRFEKRDSGMRWILGALGGVAIIGYLWKGSISRETKDAIYAASHADDLMRLISDGMRFCRDLFGIRHSPMCDCDDCAKDIEDAARRMCDFLNNETRNRNVTDTVYASELVTPDKLSTLRAKKILRNYLDEHVKQVLELDDFDMTDKQFFQFLCVWNHGKNHEKHECEEYIAESLCFKKNCSHEVCNVYRYTYLTCYSDMQDYTQFKLVFRQWVNIAWDLDGEKAEKSKLSKEEKASPSDKGKDRVDEDKVTPGKATTEDDEQSNDDNQKVGALKEEIQQNVAKRMKTYRDKKNRIRNVPDDVDTTQTKQSWRFWKKENRPAWAEPVIQWTKDHSLEVKLAFSIVGTAIVTFCVTKYLSNRGRPVTVQPVRLENPISVPFGESRGNLFCDGLFSGKDTKIQETRKGSRLIKGNKASYNVYNFDPNAAVHVASGDVPITSSAFVTYLDRLFSDPISSASIDTDKGRIRVTRQQESSRFRCFKCKKHDKSGSRHICYDDIDKRVAVELLQRTNESRTNSPAFRNIRPIENRLCKLIVRDNGKLKFVNNGFIYGQYLITTAHGFKADEDIIVSSGTTTYLVARNSFKNIGHDDLIAARIPGLASSASVSLRKPDNQMTVAMVSYRENSPYIRLGTGQTTGILHTISTDFGDCGSPLFDSEGKVVGFHVSGSTSGINSFIPVTDEVLAALQNF